MVSYGSTAAGGYQIVSYASGSSGYSPTATTWQKTTCCGAFRSGSRCTGCPGGY